MPTFMANVNPKTHQKKKKTINDNRNKNHT